MSEFIPSSICAETVGTNTFQQYVVFCASITLHLQAEYEYAATPLSYPVALLKRVNRLKIQGPV